jgi:hypothetical protein
MLVMKDDDEIGFWLPVFDSKKKSCHGQIPTHSRDHGKVGGTLWVGGSSLRRMCRRKESEVGQHG